MQETWAWSLGWENSLEKEMTTHSIILASEIPWTEEPGGLQSVGSQKCQAQLSNLTITTSETQRQVHLWLCHKWRPTPTNNSQVWNHDQGQPGAKAEAKQAKHWFLCIMTGTYNSFEPHCRSRLLVQCSEVFSLSPTNLAYCTPCNPVLKQKLWSGFICVFHKSLLW